uniref:Uncharacterized protein n=1 Tax=Manihot esculenta TaxID=3983 RepID=A0A2C9VHT0_MANES
MNRKRIPPPPYKIRNTRAGCSPMLLILISISSCKINK